MKVKKTFKWRQVKSSCIKKVYPELYEKLKAEAIERKKKKNEEKMKSGKDGDTEEPDFSKISIGITKTEKTGTFKKESTTKAKKEYSKINQGILRIKLDWLKKNKTYNLKTVFTHHLKYRERRKNSYIETRPSDKDKEIIEIIKNVTSFEKNYLSMPYNEFKVQMKSGWVSVNDNHGGRNLKKYTYGSKSDGWDISIYLNDKLIYKEEKGKEPQYFIVNKL